MHLSPQWKKLNIITGCSKLLFFFINTRTAGGKKKQCLEMPLILGVWYHQIVNCNVNAKMSVWIVKARDSIY